MRILLIEDDPGLCDSLSYQLRRPDMWSIYARTGKTRFII